MICVSGYCFLLFQDEMSVQALIEACIVDDEKLYWCVSSPTMKDKPVSPSLYVVYLPSFQLVNEAELFRFCSVLDDYVRFCNSDFIMILYSWNSIA